MRRVLGFTLIELLVVMAVLGILAAAVMPLGEALVVARKERELREALWEVRDALDRYRKHVEDGTIERVTDSGYPPNLQTLVAGAGAKRGPLSGQKLYYLRRLPRDPFAQEGMDNGASWRLRSYASPANAPAAGADVFDVMSSSDGVALDGTLYKEW